MKIAKALALTAALFAGAAAAQAQTNQSGQIIFRTPQEAVRYYEDLVGQLTNQVRSMQDDNAKLAQAMNEQQRQIQILNQNGQAMAQDIAALKRQLAAESSARQADMNRVVDKVTGAISSASQQAAAQQAAAEKAAAAQQTEMIEYTVQPGVSLSQVAKAYGASMDEIRKANNLKSDTLRIGQKLLVPKK